MLLGFFGYAIFIILFKIVNNDNKNKKGVQPDPSKI